jgi:hypothetical protein
MMRITTAAAAVAGSAFVFAVGAANAQGQNPPGVDPTHYQCYRVDPAGPLRPQPLKLKDQFASSEVRAFRALFLCNPVEKNGEGPKDKETHLVCYEIRGRPVNKRVEVEHQLGKQRLRVTSPAILCVPSIKKVM